MYCGREHQREHWAPPGGGGHKAESKELAAVGWAADLAAAAAGFSAIQEAVAIKSFGEAARASLRRTWAGPRGGSGAQSLRARARPPRTRRRRRRPPLILASCSVRARYRACRATRLGKRPSRCGAVLPIRGTQPCATTLQIIKGGRATSTAQRLFIAWRPRRVSTTRSMRSPRSCHRSRAPWLPIATFSTQRSTPSGTSRFCGGARRRSRATRRLCTALVLPTRALWGLTTTSLRVAPGLLAPPGSPCPEHLVMALESLRLQEASEAAPAQAGKNAGV